MLDFARLLSDFFFTFPFHCSLFTQDIVGWLVWAPFQPTDTWNQPKKSSRRAWSWTRQALLFCILELLRCLCRKDPLITFYWPVKLWPPIRVSSRPSQGLRGTLPALCWVIGNGLVGSTSFGSLCPIRSPLTPVPTSSA